MSEFKELKDAEQLPYFPDMDPRVFFQGLKKSGMTGFHDKYCATKDCTLAGNYNCKNELCRYRFCFHHQDHKHLVCNGLSCNDRATRVFQKYPLAFCGYHSRFYERYPDEYQVLLDYLYSRKAKSYQCKECKKFSDKLYCGEYCSSCSAMWYNLKTKGISGPFG